MLRGHQSLSRPASASPALGCTFAENVAACDRGSAPLGRSDLSASILVRFLGDSAALILVWFMAARATRELRDQGGWQALMRAIAVPLATLMILLIGYGVPLFVLGPMLNDAGLAAYHWLFVVAVMVLLFKLAFRQERPKP